ncbi:hypothetical protein [uncultured Psychroserpens sp.]|uniref:hypothetical protein n=1 Tax=uncultured Psychroserpens sp. TaxID=255436 RepID=UPI00263621CB|nr:hypothetical protein [uncultured Psychroserpens sp.]
MKNLQILLSILFSVQLYSQNLSEINRDLNISDSLNFEIEIRVYQFKGISNYSSLFRMYKKNSKKWKAEFYEHYLKANQQPESITKKQILKPLHDFEFIRLNFLRSYILELPNLQEIKWKLAKRGDVEKRKVQRRGKVIEEYDLVNSTKTPLDGNGYIIIFKDKSRNNEFHFSNPYFYLSNYSEIDELIYVCEILDMITNEFGIWKN